VGAASYFSPSDVFHPRDSLVLGYTTKKVQILPSIAKYDSFIFVEKKKKSVKLEYQMYSNCQQILILTTGYH